MIQKGVIEIPPDFIGQPPINPIAIKSKLKGNWGGCRGLAEDIKYYGNIINEEAKDILKPEQN